MQGINKAIDGSRRGEYWRLLVPGTYTVTVSAPGYTPETKVVTVTSSEPPAPTLAHFKLNSLQSSAPTQPQGNPVRGAPAQQVPVQAQQVVRDPTRVNNGLFFSQPGFQPGLPNLQGVPNLFGVPQQPGRNIRFHG